MDLRVHERIGRVVRERLGTDQPLHGFYRPAGAKYGGLAAILEAPIGDTPDLGGARLKLIAADFVAFPYGAVLTKALESFEKGRGKRCDLAFAKAYYAIEDAFSYLIRSVQRLGISSSQYRTTSLDDVKDAHLGTDVAIDVDSVLVYLRIVADCIAGTLPSLFVSRLEGLNRRDFRAQRDKILDPKKRTHTPEESILKGIYEGRDFSWFEKLSGPSGTQGIPKGLRNVRFHGKARYRVYTDSELADVLIHQGSLYDRHSYDVISDLRAVIHGLFGFMDHVVRKALDSGSVPPIADEHYPGAGSVPLTGPTGFLMSMVPVIECGPIDDE